MLKKMKMNNILQSNLSYAFAELNSMFIAFSYNIGGASEEVYKHQFYNINSDNFP